MSALARKLRRLRRFLAQALKGARFETRPYLLALQRQVVAQTARHRGPRG